jgi:hypothetical protein
MLRKIAELVGEDADAPLPRSVVDAWREIAGGAAPQGFGRFEETFRGCGVSNEALAMLREMLRVDPARRITAARAAAHPFFAARADARVEAEPGRKSGAGAGAASASGVGTKAAARADALRRRREVSDSSSDDEFDFDEGAAAASLAPRAGATSNAAAPAPDGVPSEPTAEARAAMAEIRTRHVASAQASSLPPPGIEPPPAAEERDKGDDVRDVAASLNAARVADSSSDDELDEFDRAPARAALATTGGTARAGRRLLG